MPQYKVIPGPAGVSGDQLCGFLSAGSARESQKAAAAIQAIIAYETQQGWVFQGLDTTTIHNACCGCFSKSTTELKLLVFVHE